jgi:hypothetical protein
MFIDNANNQIWVADAGNNRVLRFDVNTGGSTTDVKGVSSERPTDYALSQNYPNPFNPSTTINFSLPKEGFVTIEVHNILGQVVATLVEGRLNAGEHSVRFNAGSLASGVYLYTLRADDRYEVRKMMLMK